MATKNHNLSDYDINSVPNAKDMKVGIVVSEWNDNITGALLEGAKKTLMKHGVAESNIRVETVPGSFELVMGAQLMVKSDVDAVIAIGCVIRGDTPHFDYICEGTTYGLARLNATQSKPVIYGLITTNDAEAAVNYGAAHGALAMTTPGDTTMASKNEVEAIMSGAGARVKR